MSLNLKTIAKSIVNDFEAFCRICLTIPARDWRSPPIESTIKSIPFYLAEHQRKYVDYLLGNTSDKVVLKTRQRGYSVVTIAFILWRVLYYNNEKILYAIDVGDKARDMADLMRRMFDSIPAPFKPKGIEFRTQPYRCGNPRLNNLVTIRAATNDTGRSGTYSMVVLDEFASYDLSIQQDISASLTSSCPTNRVWISTPKREDDIYHRKVLAAEKANELWLHRYWDYYEDWFGSKAIGELWRAEQCKGLNPHQIARELDCQFKGAAEDLIWFTEPSMFRPARVNRQTRTIVSLDLGWNDSTAVLWAVDYGGILHVFDEAVVKQTTIPEVASIIKNRGYLIKYGVMDSSGKKVDQTSGLSSHRQLSRLLGCRFYTRKVPDKIEMLRIANSLMLQSRIYVDPESCPQLIKLFNNYEWVNDKIPHNDYSHLHDSFVYLVYNWAKAPKSKSQPLMAKRSEYGLR